MALQTDPGERIGVGGATTVLRVPPAPSEAVVHGALLDAVVEVVVQARGAAARAAVISELVSEVCAAVEWLHDSDPILDDPRAHEVVSIARLSRVAQDHQRQMRAVQHGP